MTGNDPFLAGSVVAGKYRLKEALGEGAMGRVVAATHLDLDREVALKFMIARRGVEEEMMLRFMREARAAARLTSEHVVRIFDVGREGNVPYLVMERLQGEDVATYLAQRTTLDPFEAADIVAQACEGIAEAHRQGIVHRDVKPQNLFLCAPSESMKARPGRRFVKVLDFGLSKIAPPPGSAKAEAAITKVPLGSPLYMAPEQLRSTTEVDKRADVWSLGTTLYELLTGDPPFVAESLGEIYLMIAQDAFTPLRERRPSIPFALDAIVSRCLEKDPNARFSDAQALGAALTRFLSSGSTTAQTPLEPLKISAEARAASSLVSPELLETALDPIGEAPTQLASIPDAILPPTLPAMPAEAPERGAAPLFHANTIGRGSLSSSTSQITPGRPKRAGWALLVIGGALALVSVVIVAGLVSRNGADPAHQTRDAQPTHEPADTPTGQTIPTSEVAAQHEPTVVPGLPAPTAATSVAISTASPSVAALPGKAPSPPPPSNGAASAPAAVPVPAVQVATPLPQPAPIPPPPTPPAVIPSSLGRNF